MRQAEKMNDTEVLQCRFNELVEELNACREDERSAQAQILEVISVACAVLGLLFGASFFKPNKMNEAITIIQNVDENSTLFFDRILQVLNSSVTYSRLMFWMSLLVFCIAFSYMTVLGMNNILRYYHIQNIQDRIRVLIYRNEVTLPDDVDRGTFLHWDEYKAPIITMNPLHITSTHTMLHYISYMMAVVCVIVFSMGIVLSMFLQIESRMWFDRLLLAAVIIFMLLSALAFFRFSYRARNIGQFAWDTAHTNQKIRFKEVKGEVYEKGKSFRRLLLYFLYPKRQDLQKPVLIVLGYICGIILLQVHLEYFHVLQLLFVVFVFDVLAYQARYQINDIRGLDEDEEAGRKNRLFTDDGSNRKHLVKVSLIIAAAKIILAVVLSIIFGGEIRGLLLISLGCILLSTILYEMAKTAKFPVFVYCCVGMGYPMRFLVGFLVLVPIECIGQYWGMGLLVAAALWAYGSFSSILAWSNEVVERMQLSWKKSRAFPKAYLKKYYLCLQNTVKKRFMDGVKKPVNGKVMPLREKGSIKDPWNIAFLIMFVCLCVFVWLQNMPVVSGIAEICICAVFLSNIYLKRRWKLLSFGLGWIAVIVKAIVGVVLWNAAAWFLVLCAMQVVMTVTYFVLIYQPQVVKFRVTEGSKNMGESILRKVLGKTGANMLLNVEAE